MKQEPTTPGQKARKKVEQPEKGSSWTGFQPPGKQPRACTRPHPQSACKRPKRKSAWTRQCSLATPTQRCLEGCACTVPEIGKSRRLSPENCLGEGKQGRRSKGQEGVLLQCVLVGPQCLQEKRAQGEPGKATGGQHSHLWLDDQVSDCQAARC